MRIEKYTVKTSFEILRVSDLSIRFCLANDLMLNSQLVYDAQFYIDINILTLSSAKICTLENLVT